MGARGPMSAEHKAKIGAANRGVPKSPEHRAKIAAARRGTTLSIETKRKLSLARLGNTYGSKGDAAGYVAMHARARAVLPTSCAHCGATEHLEVALRHDGSPSSRRLGTHGSKQIAFSIKTEDYLRLCRGCHRVYDGRAVLLRTMRARKANMSTV